MTAPAIAIFDLDGTLVDSRADLAAAGNQARAAIGLAHLPEAEVALMVGDGLQRLIERLTPGADPAARATALARFQQAYAAGCCQRTRCYAGVPEALDACAGQGWRLAVATNKPLAFTRRILDHLGLSPRLAAVRGGDGPKKPDPAQLQSIIGELGGDPQRTWMVGDHRTDILAGRAAGCRVLFCSWGMGHADGHAADATASHPRDWPGLLGRA